MKKDIYKNTLPEPTRKLIKKVEIHRSAEIPMVLKFDLPDVQKVKVENQQKFPEQKEVIFPDVQKVQIINQQPFPQIPRVPDVQAVHVMNQIADPLPPASMETVERLLQEIKEKEYPTEVRVKNPLDIPIGMGTKAGKTDPTRYVPVRLTNGERFYSALEEAYVSAAQRSFPFVDGLTGKPTPATVISGLLQTNASSTGGGSTTTSGNPSYSFQTNIPTIQTIYGQVVGDVPAQQPDSSNPVKVGASRRATLPTYLDGTRSSLHVD